MSIIDWPDKNNRLYIYIKAYTHKLRMQGHSVANRYLTQEVPQQLHKQIIEVAQRAILNLGKKEKS